MVLEAPGRLVEHCFALPEVGEDDAVLRIEACGLCGTDHEQYSGMLNPGFAFVPGHETVGVIEMIGPVAEERWGVSAGNRVVVEVFQACGACQRCQRGDYRICAKHGLAHMYGCRPIDDAPGLWGGYATYQYLAPDSLVLPVPPGLDPITATLFNPLGAGLRWAVELPSTRPGDVVVVLGPGIRGISALAAVKRAGASFVMVTGLGPGDRARLQLAARFGADLTLDVSTHDPVKVLRAATGGLADVVVDVTAKAPGALAQAVSLARSGGTVVVAGTKGSPDAPGFAPDLLVFKELRLLGALGVDTGSYRVALEMLSSAALPFGDIPTTVVGLEGLDGLLASMAGQSQPVPALHGVLVP